MAFFSCDDAVRALWTEPMFAQQVAGIFGAQVVHPDGSIDRSKVRELVFSDLKHRLKLEEVTHPRVFDELEAARASAETSGAAKVFVAEVPLYYETGTSVSADLVIVVAASPDVQRARLMEHRKLDAATCAKMLEAQLPLEHKIQEADVVIWNDGGHLILEAQALTLLRDRWEP